MLKEKIKSFKKANKDLDVLGLVRNMYPGIEVESIPQKKKKKKNAI